jgi:inner membrane protein
MRQSLRNSVFMKVILIGIITIIMLVPLLLIRTLISERQGRRDEAAFEVSEKWGSYQTIAGPFLTIPYRVYWVDENKVQRTGRKYAQFLPDELTMDATILPEIRSRGIFNVVVYRASIHMYGYFLTIDTKELKVPVNDIIWDEIYLSIAIPDMRGIREGIVLKWNDSSQIFQPGMIDQDIFASGIHAKLPNFENSMNKRSSFDLHINLNGSEELYFVPVGKHNSTTIKSTWPDPSFVGSYLPIEHEISSEGFKASWEISYFSRSYPQSWKSDTAHFQILSDAMGSSAYGTKLFLSVDHYHKTMRSVKYAILFIILTFVAFFLFEIINKMSIHPFQYFLVGLAMSVFYLLLLSVSEHLKFTYSYILASAVTIGIISGYSIRVFNRKRQSIFFTLLLVLLYSCLFILIQLEDYALLLGSIIVFLVLGFVMYLTRGIDWYSFRIDRNDPEHRDQGRSHGKPK